MSKQSGTKRNLFLTENHSQKATHTFLRGRHGVLFFAAIAAFVLFFAVVVCVVLVRGRGGEPEVTIHAENRFETTLRAVTDRDYEPFSYIDKNGNYAGLDVELITEVANRLQMNLDFVLLDWTDANEHFERGEADVFLNLEADSVVASRSMIATIPTAEKQYVVYGRRKVSSVAELYGTRVASLHRLPELGLDSSITYFDSYAEIFAALSRGDFDFAICPIQVGNVFLQKLDLRDIQPSYAVSHIYGVMALAPQNAALCERINAVLSDLWREGFMTELDRKWISHRYQNTTLRSMLAANPWIVGVFVALLLVVASLAVSFSFQHRIAREQEEANRAKTAFLSNMSHDIRTPMNAIIGYTNLARQTGTSAAEIQSFLEKIDSSSKHLLALINDVLEMSRIESGKLEQEKSPCDLRRVMDDVRDMFATQMTEKRIDFTVDASGVQNPLVLCDKNRLNRVLLNLISNAYKFTNEGGKVSVVLTQKSVVEFMHPQSGLQTTKRTGISTGSMPTFAEYELRVKDSGIGMSAEFAERVFDAFERERTSTVSGIQGTGLGMAITKSIVDLMGGTITVRTEQGKGTEFVVTAALEVQSDDNALGIEAPTANGGRSEATAGSVGMERESAEVRKARPERSEGNAQKENERQTPTFRNATEADTDEICSLIKSATAEMTAHGIDQWDEVYPTREEVLRDIEQNTLRVGEIAADGKTRLAVIYTLNHESNAEYDGAKWQCNGDYLVLHRLCVHLDFQHRGIATLALRHAEDEASKNGAKSIRLDVFSKNPFSLRLYEKAGYKKTGEAQWRKGLFYLMEKSLATKEKEKKEIDLSSLRVLLVDDMDVNRELATMILESEGIAVETVVNGQDAVDKVAGAEEGHFDAVLMDIQMPILDGYGAARAIRSLSDKTKARVPIIAMTANAFSEDVKKARDAGMNAHVAKPIDVAVLMSALRDCVEKSRRG